MVQIKPSWCHLGSPSVALLPNFFQGDFSYADMKHDGVVTVTLLKQMTMTTVMTKDDDETMPMQA